MFVLRGYRVRARRVAVADVLERLARIASSGRGFDPVTRMAQKVSQVAERVALAMVVAR
jgi:hypothetical protein